MVDLPAKCNRRNEHMGTKLKVCKQDSAEVGMTAIQGPPCMPNVKQEQPGQTYPSVSVLGNKA